LVPTPRTPSADDFSVSLLFLICSNLAWGIIRLTPQAASPSYAADSDLSESGAPDIAVTPAMIEAGVTAYYENAWEYPSAEMIGDAVRAIFLAMSSESPAV
jgi:hypothetical protein